MKMLTYDEQQKKSKPTRKTPKSPFVTHLLFLFWFDLYFCVPPGVQVPQVENCSSNETEYTAV
jgi:hypothetical protein